MWGRSGDSADFEAFNGNLRSFTLGNLSEDYGAGYGSSVNNVKTCLRSKRAQRWMGRYAGGGFDVN